MLRDRFPHITIDLDHELPGDRAGVWIGNTIYIDRRLTQAARRSTIEHEVCHLDRGVLPEEPVLVAREEAIVDELAARKLITIEALVDALRWCQGVASAEFADEVWTDRHTLNVRLATLTHVERAQIAAELANCEWMD
ncbi:hypothetical protein [Rhodococcus sp. ABRD24]|uniref:hypothetical protein n=1 Tax=Rhodococcus sp. ABRD24 TaxID=2507582 RepID=UPI001F61334A|nr:hypothetical protein [Rhodococcus sp. ABRD24]